MQTPRAAQRRVQRHRHELYAVALAPVQRGELGALAAQYLVPQPLPTIEGREKSSQTLSERQKVSETALVSF